jgi:hypothetical protein
MKQQSYRVVLEGTVRQGFQRSTVAEKLAKIFRKDLRVTDKLLSGTPKLIRSGLGLEEATKYQRILETAGAAVSVEPEHLDREVSGPPDGREPSKREPESETTLKARSTPPQQPSMQRQPGTRSRPQNEPDPALDEPKAVATPAHPESGQPAGVACPKCGYRPTSRHDVLLVRGDCPRCGLRANKALDPEEPDTAEAELLMRKRRPEAIYFDRTPASWDRRTVATVYTFSIFLAAYAGLVFLFILAFVPLESLPRHLGTAFLSTAIQDFPVLLISVAVLVVAFVIPVFNGGLTWGQRLAGIEVVYTAEAQIGGLYATLILRTIVALLLTFGLAWVVLWLGESRFWFVSSWSAKAVTIVSAAFTWGASALYGWSREDMRGVFDLVTGTLQVEEGPMPDDAFGKACKRLLAVVGIWVFLGCVLPLTVGFLSGGH